MENVYRVQTINMTLLQPNFPSSFSCSSFIFHFHIIAFLALRGYFRLIEVNLNFQFNQEENR